MSLEVSATPQAAYISISAIDGHGCDRDAADPWGRTATVWQRACTRSTGNAGMGWTIGTCSMSTCNCLGAAKMASVSEKNGIVCLVESRTRRSDRSGTGLGPAGRSASSMTMEVIAGRDEPDPQRLFHGRIDRLHVTDGETCVRRAAEESRMVLMDIAMPGGGIEATRLLRSLSPRRTSMTSLSPSGAERGGGGPRVRVENRCGGRYHPPHHRGVCGRAAVQRPIETAVDDLSVTRPRSRRDEARALLTRCPTASARP